MGNWLEVTIDSCILRLYYMWLNTNIPANLQSRIYNRLIDYSGIKMRCLFANTTLILYQARDGEGRVGGSALPSKTKLGLKAPTR